MKMLVCRQPSDSAAAHPSNAPVVSTVALRNVHDVTLCECGPHQRRVRVVEHRHPSRLWTLIEALQQDEATAIVRRQLPVKKSEALYIQQLQSRLFRDARRDNKKIAVEVLVWEAVLVFNEHLYVHITKSPKFKYVHI